MVHDPARERTHQSPSEGRVVVRPDDRPPGRELSASLKRLWRDERPGVAIPRDIGVVLVALMVILGGLWVYTGQPFPSTSPLVVVESGSMMHPETPYGKVGTIDPGDLILVKFVTDHREIKTAYDPGDQTSYGGMGDVIIFRPYERQHATPIIHRAITWVEVTEVMTVEGPEPRYSYHNENGELLVDQRSVTLPSVGITERQFPASGFVTKGDNPRTNIIADQIAHTPGALVEPSWIVGKARGEVPWIGLIKLAVAGNPVPADRADQCQVLRAWAPCDTWFMLGASIGTLVLVPLVLEQVYRRSPRMKEWFE